MVAEYKTPSDRKKLYRSADWCGQDGLRLQALERDNYECVECRREGKVTADSVKVDGKPKAIKLNVDHIYPVEHYPKLALVLDNLQTLCVYHHNVKEGRVFGRSNKKKKWDDEAW